MRVLMAVITNGWAQLYKPKPETKQMYERDVEAQLLELKLAFKHLNPKIAENVEFWKKYVQEKRSYGLFILVDNDQKAIEFLPMETKQDYDRWIEHVKKWQGSK